MEMKPSGRDGGGIMNYAGVVYCFLADRCPNVLVAMLAEQDYFLKERIREK